MQHLGSTPHCLDHTGSKWAWPGAYSRNYPGDLLSQEMVTGLSRYGLMTPGADPHAPFLERRCPGEEERAAVARPALTDCAVACAWPLHCCAVEGSASVCRRCSFFSSSFQPPMPVKSPFSWYLELAFNLNS